MLCHRSFLLASIFLLRAATAGAQPSTRDIPITGTAPRELAAIDRLMLDLMRDHAVPGASLAITKNSRLVYARGFGYADLEAKQPVQPTSLFRIASVSKPITAVAVLQLAERGKLGLDDRAFDLLKLDPFTPPGTGPDPRLERVTIRQLLQHTGGWDRDRSGDPMSQQAQIASAMGLGAVAPEDIVRYAMGRPLDFAPGTRHAYSNLGYCVLGRVIEAVDHGPYEAYVQRCVLAPLNIRNMKQGRSLAAERWPGEVTYYRYPRRPTATQPADAERARTPDEGRWLEAHDANGGWVASAVDLARFACAFDVPARCPILSRESIGTMFGPPDGTAGHETGGQVRGSYYACGWHVRSAGPSWFNTWHTGLLMSGTSSELVRRHDKINWVVLFNTDFARDGKTLVGHVDAPLNRAISGIDRWPAIDLFTSAQR